MLHHKKIAILGLGLLMYIGLAPQASPAESLSTDKVHSQKISKENWVSPIMGVIVDTIGKALSGCLVEYAGLVKISDLATPEAVSEYKRKEAEFWKTSPISKVEYNARIKGSVVTDLKGYFTTLPLPLPGKFPTLVYYSVTVKCTGFIQQEAQFVEPGKNKLSFRMRMGMKLGGSVYDGQTHETLKGVTIAVDLRDTAPSEDWTLTDEEKDQDAIRYHTAYWLFAVTDDNGQFTFDGVPPGLVKVSVWEVPIGYKFNLDKRVVDTRRLDRIEFTNVYKKP